ncbi:MAG TPA: carboxyltransferase domain-containing protein, partial [Burkholderiales bacterium]|nr:carboxyltransferase domain-containing protein [Burkholderiales bacterium]
YFVGMLGFAPGFPYLAGMDQRLIAARRATPRPRVPAGSVAIGGEHTGIYPFASPGGWHLIGRTPLTLFALDRDPPSLLQAGDRVRFVPIAPDEFQRTAEFERTAEERRA